MMHNAAAQGKMPWHVQCHKLDYNAAAKCKRLWHVEQATPLQTPMSQYHDG